MAKKVTSSKIEEGPRGEPQYQEDCDICGEKGKFYARQKYCTLLVCKVCGLIWTNPVKFKTSDSILTSREVFWAEEVYQAGAESQKKRFREQLECILKKIGLAEAKSLKLLEVGCGMGFFLDVCEEYGIDARGCDVAEKALKFANRNSPRARAGTLDSHYPDNSFDLICGFNLIEHLPHPLELIKQAERVLRPGGILVLETPIQESMFHRLARIGYLLSKGEIRFYGMHPGGHCCKLSRKTFRFVCEEMGFECLYQKRISSPFKELWGKSAEFAFRLKQLYRFSLPLVWTLSRLTGQGNRLFIILRKKKD